MTTDKESNGHAKRSVTGQLIPDDAVERAALRATADPPDIGADLRYAMVGDLIVEAIAGEVLPDGYEDSFEQATLRAIAVDLRALVIAMANEGFADETSPTCELSDEQIRGALSRLAVRAAAAAELGARMRRAGRPEAPEAIPRDMAGSANTNGNGHASKGVQ